MPDVRPREAVTLPPAVPPPPPSPPSSKPRKSRKRWWAVGVLAMALLAGGGLYVAYRATTEKAVPAASLPSLAVPVAPVAPTVTVAATLGATQPVAQPSAAVSGTPTAPVTDVPSSSPKVTKTAAAKVTGKANPGGANLALSGVVAASSTEGGPFTADRAVDGDSSTRWSSGFAEPQWLRVDLRERRQLTEVTLVWEHSHATAYRVDVSLDGRTWRPIFSTTAGRGGTVKVAAGGAVARYVRMYGTKRSTQYGFSLFEFQVK